MSGYSFLSREMRSIEAAIITRDTDQPIQTPDAGNLPAEPEQDLIGMVATVDQVADNLSERFSSDDPSNTLQSPLGFVLVELASGKDVPLDGATVFGRDPTAEHVFGQPVGRIALPSVRYLSRNHLAIIPLDGVAHALDMGSVNGTCLIRSGEIIQLQHQTPVALQVADVLALGVDISIKVKML